MSTDITAFLNAPVAVVASKVIKFDFANKETTVCEGEEGPN